MKKVSVRLLLWFACAAALFAAGAAEAELAPLNPAFEDYISRYSDGLPSLNRMAGNSAGEAKERNFGYIPSPLNWSHLDGAVYSTAPSSTGGRNLRGAGDKLPARYDSRPSLPPVRNQGKFSNCWAYSAMAATESSLIRSGLVLSSDIELSTWYITYYAYNDGDFISFTNPGKKRYYNAGGNDWVAVALLARGTGSLPEEDAPAPKSPADAYAPAIKMRKYKLDNAFYLGDDGKVSVELSAERRDMIKSAIMDFGAVSAGIYQYGDNEESREDIDRDVYSQDGLSYYTGRSYGKDEPDGALLHSNHSIALVGWDDAYPKEKFAEGNRPKNNGAWIVRNSWGDDWGDAGYFYVSYEEGTLADGVVYATSAALSGERLYQYDPLGCVSWYRPGPGLVSYFANIFTAEGNDRISSIAFYVPSPGIEYEIFIYKDCGDYPSSGTPASASAISDLVPGYNTVLLAEPVDVTMGTKFSVVIKATVQAGGYSYAVPIEQKLSNYSENAEAKRGEGWISEDGATFYDVMDEKELDSASVCIKAFGTRQHKAEDTSIVPGKAESVGRTELTVDASAVDERRQGKREKDIIKYLDEECVDGIDPDKNVTLKGVFEMTVEQAEDGEAASFSVPVLPLFNFSGKPYVIIPSDSGYDALPAEYQESRFVFSVSDISSYFPTAEITIADVLDSTQRYEPAGESGGGGGCSAGVCPQALLLLIPFAALAVRRRTGRRS